VTSPTADRLSREASSHSRRPQAGRRPQLAYSQANGKLYLCAVKDACSKRIVGYSIDSRMTSDLAVNALRNAHALRGPIATVVHSDRGSPVPLARLRAHAAPSVAPRLDGLGSGLRRQRRNGVLLQLSGPLFDFGVIPEEPTKL
jgi:transposase InsO family protein